jgi:hypothetical protein
VYILCTWTVLLYWPGDGYYIAETWGNVNNWLLSFYDKFCVYRWTNIPLYCYNTTGWLLLNKNCCYYIKHFCSSSPQTAVISWILSHKYSLITSCTIYSSLFPDYSNSKSISGTTKYKRKYIMKHCCILYCTAQLLSVNS